VLDLSPTPSGRRVLVTGGAGFVGSHVARALALRGDAVVVLDDLSQGHRAAVPPGSALVAASLADRGAVDGVLADGPWDAVLHFAALSLVGESMGDPCRYLLANAGQGFALIDACVRHGVRRFVLSSTANLFGDPDSVPIPESAPLRPSSPYGESKWMLERALRWADQAHGLRFASLRYFNAAGCDPDGHLGEDHDPETHLIPLAVDAALGRRPALTVFGDDYPTADGTAVRDYVHVSDLASAHLLALGRLEDGSATYNLGNGAGYSVLDVVRAVERVSGLTVPLRMGARRAGDPAVLVASSALIRAELGWTPQHPDLADIVRTAYEWRRAHPHGYGDKHHPRVQVMSADMCRATA
jgi:UDP-glucose 4-epimerase